MRQSVMQHAFSQVPSAEIERSSFNRSHGYKTTLDAGYLVPIFCDEKLPADTDHLQVNLFGRLATPIKPIMDNMFMDVHFFFVPNRLVWDNWQRMMGERDPDPDSSIDYTVPISTAPVGGYANGSLQDYFGLPTEVAGYEHITLPIRAYNLIWNTWYRDQNLQDSVTVDKGDGPDTVTNYVLLRRGKRHDYFTSCLPWPQKGDAAELPLGVSAPITVTSTAYSKGTNIYDAATFATSRGVLRAWGAGVIPAGYLDETAPHAGSGSENVALRGEMTQAQITAAGMVADLSNATAATINSLRQAFQIQRMYERDARGGTRYVELLKSHFRVDSPDARLQRPEYLGGGKLAVNVNPIAQTSNNDTQDTPQGNLAAMGTVSGKVGYTKSFVEHGYVIGLVSVRADLTYQQGLLRPWSRQTRFDYYWPALAHLGEQAVLNKEIYCQGTAGGAADDSVFGYQERFADYRYKPSQVTGQFRSNYATSLDFWHLSQEFSALPVLNTSFIQDNPPIDRVIAVPAEPHFLLDCWFDFKCARPMPVFGVPGLIDHF